MTDKPITKFILPMLVWICVGMFVFIMSSFMLSSPDIGICEITENNRRSDQFRSIEVERESCLKAYDHATKMFGYGAWAIGVIMGIMRVITSDPEDNDNNTNCQRCGKGYGLGFIWIPKKEWNVKETKVCRKCFKEIEGEHDN